MNVGPPLKVVDGLAFDSVSRRLYYSDTGPKNHSISRCGWQ